MLSLILWQAPSLSTLLWMARGVDWCQPPMAWSWIPLMFFPVYKCTMTRADFHTVVCFPKVFGLVEDKNSLKFIARQHDSNPARCLIGTAFSFPHAIAQCFEGRSQKTSWKWWILCFQQQYQLCDFFFLITCINREIYYYHTYFIYVRKAAASLKMCFASFGCWGFIAKNAMQNAVFPFIRWGKASLPTLNLKVMFIYNWKPIIAHYPT